MAAVSALKGLVPNKSVAFLTRPFAYFLLKELQHWNGTFFFNVSVLTMALNICLLQLRCPPFVVKHLPQSTL